MWNKLQDTEYFVNLCVEKYYEVFITDFVSIWALRTSKETFISYIKECNKKLLTSEQILLKHVEDMLNNPENATCKITIESSVMTVSIDKKTQNGYTIYLNINLTKSSEEVFFNKVTLPLMNVVKNLQVSQNELCDTIAKKDKEISNYKMEGAKISLKYLKTPKFDESKHLSKYSEYSRTFGTNNIPETILEKKVDNGFVEIKEEIIKEEPNQPIKEEPNQPIKEEQNQPIKEEQNQPIKEEPPSQESAETSKASSSTTSLVVKREGASSNLKKNKIRKVHCLKDVVNDNPFYNF